MLIMNESVIQKETPEVVTENPKELITIFRNSKEYSNAFSTFYNGKNLASDVTQEEKREVFENQNETANTLLEFAKKHKVTFKYNPIFFPGEAQQAISDYEQSMRDMIKMHRINTPGQIMQYDSYRFSCHNLAAASLTKANIAPSHNMGKAMVKLLMISKGLDSHGASMSDPFVAARAQQTTVTAT